MHFFDESKMQEVVNTRDILILHTRVCGMSDQALFQSDYRDVFIDCLLPDALIRLAKLQSKQAEAFMIREWADELFERAQLHPHAACDCCR